jgi:hypothetical protein
VKVVQFITVLCDAGFAFCFSCRLEVVNTSESEKDGVPAILGVWCAIKQASNVASRRVLAGFCEQASPVNYLDIWLI